jgi:hypothetical protein
MTTTAKLQAAARLKPRFALDARGSIDCVNEAAGAQAGRRDTPA